MRGSTRVMLLLLLVSVPVPIVVGITVAVVGVGEEAASATAPVNEAERTGATANEAAGPEPRMRNAHTWPRTHVANGARPAEVDAHLTSPHRRPCRSASEREDESGQEDDRQATISISACGGHGDSRAPPVTSAQG